MDEPLTPEELEARDVYSLEGTESDFDEDAYIQARLWATIDDLKRQLAEVTAERDKLAAYAVTFDRARTQRQRWLAWVALIDASLPFVCDDDKGEG